MTAIPTGQQPQHQPHRRAGISAVENLIRFLKSVETHPLNPDDATGFNRADGDPHRPQTCRSADRILCWKQPLNGRDARGDGTEQQ